MSESRLKEIAAERSMLLRKLDALGAEKYELLLKKHNIVIGMLVTDKHGKVYKVESARFLDGYGIPWLMGYQRRKDGSFGKHLMHTYGDWKKLEAQ